MLKCFKTNPKEQTLEEIPDITPDCWIDLSEPSPEEIDKVAKATHVERDLMVKMLDSEELPRIETEKNATMVVVDVPFFVSQEDKYVTYPLGIIITSNNYIITISPKNLPLLNQFRSGEFKDVRTAKKTRFLIQILHANATSYLHALKDIYREIDGKEEILKKSSNNEDLVDLLATEKTLVYFIASLNENDNVITRLNNNNNSIQFYEGDADLLEDAAIENRQAIDMADIYRKILSSITETYANVVSNNLNYTMRFLAGVTIILSIPTIISSYFGMNVWFGSVGTNHHSWWVLIVFSVLVSIGVGAWLKKKGML